MYWTVRSLNACLDYTKKSRVGEFTPSQQPVSRHFESRGDMFECKFLSETRRKHLSLFLLDLLSQLVLANIWKSLEKNVM